MWECDRGAGVAVHKHAGFCQVTVDVARDFYCLKHDGIFFGWYIRLNKITLGVVGVVGCLSPIVGHIEGAKVPNFDENPPFCFFQNKVECPPYPYKILSEKATYDFEKFGKTYLTRLPNSEVPEKAEQGKRSSVIMGRIWRSIQLLHIRRLIRLSAAAWGSWGSVVVKIHKRIMVIILLRITHVSCDVTACDSSSSSSRASNSSVTRQYGGSIDLFARRRWQLNRLDSGESQ